MNATDLLEDAQKQTGLTDFGVDTFREGLERLVRSVNETARLNEIGEVVVPGLITQPLVNRLQIEDWYARHPEIDDEDITAPLIGLGLPRTGSTALAALLGEDPNARSLRVWESGHPCPPPSTVAPPDPRIAAAEESHALQAEFAPRLMALVPSSPTGPMECQDLMALDFKAQYFQAFAEVRSYAEWLVDADLDSTYAYERRALKLLQWGQPHLASPDGGSHPRPWRLKCPSHLLWLDHLDTAFPDARFVMTHRDPTDVMVSVADVYAEVMGQFSDELDRHYLGQLNVEQWTIGMDRALAFREAHGDDRFFDMDFRAVQADPIGQVRALYDWLGEPVTDEFEAGMRRWWHDNAEEREANVHPDPEDFGLDLDEVRKGFAPYVARFVSAPR